MPKTLRASSATIKAAIEASANVKVNLSVYNCTGWEGYANSLPLTPTVKWSPNVGIWYEKSKEVASANKSECKSVSSYGNPSKEAARVAALILLAVELGVPVEPAWKTVTKEKDEAEWNARMGLREGTK